MWGPCCVIMVTLPGLLPYVPVFEGSVGGCQKIREGAVLHGPLRKRRLRKARGLASREGCPTAKLLRCFAVVCRVGELRCVRVLPRFTLLRPVQLTVVSSVPRSEWQLIYESLSGPELPIQSRSMRV